MHDIFVSCRACVGVPSGQTSAGHKQDTCPALQHRARHFFVRFIRVWKGILGIRDLTKIRCGIRENAKDLAGIRDLTATREAGYAKIWARDAGFCCLSFGNSGNRHDPNKRYSGKPAEHKISIERANLHLKFISFCRS